MTLVLVLLSGGIDSTTLIHYYQEQHINIMALWVDYGQPAARAERIAASATARTYGIHLSKIKTNGILWRSGKQSDELVGRNLLLASIGVAAFPGTFGMISMGIHAGTGYVDCSLQFQRAVSEVIQSVSSGRLDADFPFGAWTKREIAEYCKEHSVPIERTYSCLTGTIPPCGQCSSCKDKAMVEAVLRS